MNIVLEILAALANCTVVTGFVLERWEKHKRRRMDAEEKVEAGGHRLQ